MNENIPELIKYLRSQINLTQEQFAQKNGVTYSTVNHWVNDKRVSKPFLLCRLLDMKERPGNKTSEE